MFGKFFFLIFISIRKVSSIIPCKSITFTETKTKTIFFESTLIKKDNETIWEHVKETITRLTPFFINEEVTRTEIKEKTNITSFYETSIIEKKETQTELFTITSFLYSTSTKYNGTSLTTVTEYTSTENRTYTYFLTKTIKTTKTDGYISTLTQLIII